MEVLEGILLLCLPLLAVAENICDSSTVCLALEESVAAIIVSAFLLIGCTQIGVDS